MSIYQRIASLIPKSVVKAFQKELRYVGIQVNETRFVGFIALFGFGIAIAISVNLYLFFDISPILSFILIFLGFGGGIYYWLSQVADSEGKVVEKTLPDVLELISSNVRSGLTAERALFTSARPEFGVLSEELKKASKEIMSGERMENALMVLPQKIKSKSLERTIWLLVQGIKSGGEIADLLLQLGSDLREENSMKEEISSNISMYVLLIFVAALFGAPLLFGINSLIVGTIIEQTGNVNITESQMESYSGMSTIGRFMSVPKINLTESFVVTFSILALAITGIFASFTIGAMGEGSEKEGIRYIPIMLIGSIAIFFAVRIMLGGIMGSMSTMM